MFNGNNIKTRTLLLIYRNPKQLRSKYFVHFCAKDIVQAVIQGLQDAYTGCRFSKIPLMLSYLLPLFRGFLQTTLCNCSSAKCLGDGIQMHHAKSQLVNPSFVSFQRSTVGAQRELWNPEMSRRLQYSLGGSSQSN